MDLDNPLLTIVADFIIPGFGGTILVAIKSITGLCNEMKENKVMCENVAKRHLVIWEELKKIDDENMLAEKHVIPQFGEALVKFMNFLKNERGKSTVFRLHASRHLVEELTKLNSEIDFILSLLNLVDIKNASQWRKQMEEDQNVMFSQMEQVLLNTDFLVAELKKERDLRQAMTQLKHEYERPDTGNSSAYNTLMRQTYAKIAQASNMNEEEVPPWFIPENEVNCPVASVDAGTYGTVHRGTMGKGTQVIIKRMLTDTEAARKTFLKEVQLWSQLNDLHILKLYGGCHVSTPVFFVCEDATNGNFKRFFEDANSQNQQELWRLFHEAALGLHYLHSHKIVHGDLKCNNLLVGMDNKAKICDFGFSFIRSESVVLSTKAQTDGSRWKALECMNDQDEDEASKNPKFKSDVYSLGMCIIEAVSGDVPWGSEASEMDIVTSLFEGEAHPRPNGFTDKQWAVVSQLIVIDENDRIDLSTAIDRLKMLADDEAHAKAVAARAPRTRRCPGCRAAVDLTMRFCGKCGCDTTPNAATHL